MEDETYMEGRRVPGNGDSEALGISEVPRPGEDLRHAASTIEPPPRTRGREGGRRATP